MKDSDKLFRLGHLRDRIKTPEIIVLFNKLIKESFDYCIEEKKRLSKIKYEDIYSEEDGKLQRK